jgi:CMP-N-acetylneuraminic acid synthetase
MKIIAMIPARIGSTRLKMKNLALVNGKPLIAYSILAAKQAGVFDRIVVNSDSHIFESIASSYGAEFYERPEYLGRSTIKSDDVVLDFMQNNKSDVIVWVNSISPLQTGEEIRRVVKFFKKEKLDSLITVKDEQVHCVYKGKPVNFEESTKFAQTQELEPVQPFVYSVMMWRTESFLDNMKSQGHALLSGKVGYYPVNKLSSIIIKTEQDLKLAHYVLKSIENDEYELEYDKLVLSVPKSKQKSVNSK